MDKSYKIIGDNKIKDVETFGKSEWNFTFFKFCAKTNELHYQDHFIIQEPLKFSDNGEIRFNDQRLFVGLNEIVFWVTRSANNELSLSTLNVDEKKPYEIPIGSESKLKDFWLKGKDHYFDGASIPTAIPTMLTAQDRRVLAFSFHRLGETASVYFYDVQLQKETR